MFSQFDAPSHASNAKYSLSAVAKLVWVGLFGARNGTIQEAALSDTAKAVSQSAVATNGTITVWTPAAGNVVQITHLSIAASVAGQYTVTFNAVAVWTGLLVANTSFLLYSANPGHFAYPIAGAIAMVNQSGVASNLYLNVWGTEVGG